MIMRPICKSGNGCQLQKDFIGISSMGISIIIKPNNRPSDETAWPRMDRGGCTPRATRALAQGSAQTFLVFRFLAQPTWMPRHSTSRRPDLLARGSPTDTQFSRPSCSCPTPQPPTAAAAASWSRPPLWPSLGWPPGSAPAPARKDQTPEHWPPAAAAGHPPPHVRTSHQVQVLYCALPP